MEETPDVASIIDRLTAGLRRISAEIGADGALSLEIAVAVVLVLAVLAGWLLHVLWVALGTRQATLAARAEAAEAEARGWRAEAARLARLLDEAAADHAPEAPPGDAQPEDAQPGAAEPRSDPALPPESGPIPPPTRENHAGETGNRGGEVKDGHDKPDRVG